MGFIIFGKRHFITKKYNHMPIFIDELPRTVNFGIMNKIISSNQWLDISMHITPIGDDTIMEILDSDNEKLNAEISQDRVISSRYRRMVRKMESIKELQDYIISGKGHIYEFSILLFPKGDGFKESEKSYRSISFELKKHMFKFYRPYYRQDIAFRNLLPTGESRVEKALHIHTHAVSAFFPFLADYIYMDGGVFYGINDRNGSPVFINRWNFPSSHYIITGTTGFGKSYFVKLMILREMINDPSIRIYIIDPMGEYSSLVKLLGGTNVRVGEKGNEINPLDIDDQRRFREKVSRLRNIFSILLNMDKREMALLDASLTMLYNKKNDPKISDLLEILKDHGEVNFYRTMENIFNGSLKNLNSETRVNLNRKVISFDLSHLSDEYLTLYMAIILEHIYERISRDYEKKLVVIDEAWKLLRNEYSAIFLDSMFRHVRRWKCGMNVISQKADDFLENIYGRSMANNSLFHVLFKHPAISDNARDFYKLNQREEDYIINAEKPRAGRYSQAYFISHPLRFPLKVVSTKEENSFITTDPDELRAKISSSGNP
ncbi:MAG: VirB4 family type IV secretion system protein [Thermoplasmata archaeon]|jgi:hypothetical protein